jgi:hypothetical protein
LTVDEFREIWFQNAADPPSFRQPRPAIDTIEDHERDPEEVEETELLSAVVDTNPKNAAIEETEETERNEEDGENEENGEVDEAEAQAAFLEEMVADKFLEEEINRHLGQEEFRQALVEMDGNVIRDSVNSSNTRRTS